MRHEVAPSLLGFLFLLTVVKESCGERPGNRKEDEPISGWKFELQSRNSYIK